MKASKAQLIRDLEVRIKHLEQALADERSIVVEEKLMRVSAQRGLTPYVTAVQALNAWLADRPELDETMAPILQQLGLLGVRVGYDPDKEFATSLIAARPKKAGAEQLRQAAAAWSRTAKRNTA